jgi:hypothetical protein
VSGLQPLRTTSRCRCSAPILNIGDADEWQAVEEKWNIRLALRGLSRRRLNEVFHHFGPEDGLGCADEFAEIICAPTTSDQRPDARYGLGATRQRPGIQSRLPIGNMRVSSVPWRPRERGSAIRRMGRCGISARQWPDSFGLDACGSDHVGPLLGFVRNELAKVGRRACERAAT